MRDGRRRVPVLEHLDQVGRVLRQREGTECGGGRGPNHLGSPAVLHQVEHRLAGARATQLLGLAVGRRAIAQDLQRLQRVQRRVGVRRPAAPVDGRQSDEHVPDDLDRGGQAGASIGGIGGPGQARQGPGDRRRPRISLDAREAHQDAAQPHQLGHVQLGALERPDQGDEGRVEGGDVRFVTEPFQQARQDSRPQLQLVRRVRGPGEGLAQGGRDAGADARVEVVELFQRVLGTLVERGEEALAAQLLRLATARQQQLGAGARLDRVQVGRRHLRVRKPGAEEVVQPLGRGEPSPRVGLVEGHDQLRGQLVATQRAHAARGGGEQLGVGAVAREDRLEALLPLGVFVQAGVDATQRLLALGLAFQLAAGRQPPDGLATGDPHEAIDLGLGRRLGGGRRPALHLGPRGSALRRALDGHGPLGRIPLAASRRLEARGGFGRGARRRVGCAARRWIGAGHRRTRRFAVPLDLRSGPDRGDLDRAAAGLVQLGIGRPGQTAGGAAADEHAQNEEAHEGAPAGSLALVSRSFRLPSRPHPLARS